MGTETKTRKCPLPSDTKDCIAKEPAERSVEDKAYFDIPTEICWKNFSTCQMNTRPDIYYAVGSSRSRFGL